MATNAQNGILHPSHSVFGFRRSSVLKSGVLTKENYRDKAICVVSDATNPPRVYCLFVYEVGKNGRVRYGVFARHVSPDTETVAKLSEYKKLEDALAAANMEGLDLGGSGIRRATPEMIPAGWPPPGRNP